MGVAGGWTEDEVFGQGEIRPALHLISRVASRRIGHRELRQRASARRPHILQREPACHRREILPSADQREEGWIRNLHHVPTRRDAIVEIAEVRLEKTRGRRVFPAQSRPYV